MISDDFLLLAGLGNPGTKFTRTRHNVGYMAIERIAKTDSALFSTNKSLFGKITSIGMGDQKKRLLMPTTYMNESGRSISAALKWFNLQTQQLLVIVDDMDLPLGKLRLREAGGSGGHNGLKSIIEYLGSQHFSRLRIGIGAPSPIQEERKKQTTSHVLGPFNKNETLILEDVLDNLIKGLDLINTSGFEKGSTYINSYKSELTK